MLQRRREERRGNASHASVYDYQASWRFVWTYSEHRLIGTLNEFLHSFALSVAKHSFAPGCLFSLVYKDFWILIWWFFIKTYIDAKTLSIDHSALQFSHFNFLWLPGGSIYSENTVSFECQKTRLSRIWYLLILISFHSTDSTNIYSFL